MHEQRDRESTMGEKIGVALAWMQAFAMPLELCFRKPGTAGERYFGGRVLIGIFLMIVVIALVGGEGRGFTRATPNPYGLQLFNSPPQEPSYAPGMFDGYLIPFCFFGTLLWWAVHKSKEKANARQGKWAWHSAYNGESWCDADDWKVKLNKEPALAVLLGCLTLVVSTGLGAYLIVGGFCLGATASSQRMEYQAKRRAMRDALAEQQSIMDGIRQE